MAGDGQVTLGTNVVKPNAVKVRRLSEGRVLAGFAGAAADAFTLLEKLEAQLETHASQFSRACVELAKEWRTSRYLRRLEALLVVADRETSYLISGTGDLIAPSDGVLAIGSGGTHALAAARALLAHSDLEAEAIARNAMKIAADLCIYTNHTLTLEKL